MIAFFALPTLRELSTITDGAAAGYLPTSLPGAVACFGYLEPWGRFRET